MKHIKSLTSSALAAAMVLLCTSCGGTEAAADISTADTTAAETAETAPAKVKLFDASGIYFGLVRGDESSDAVNKTCGALEKNVRNCFGKSLTLTTDFHAAWLEFKDDANEILVGMTNRQASADFYERLPDGGYGYTVTENKVVILGRDDSLTALAANAFINGVLAPNAKKTDTLEIEVGTEMIYTKSDYDSSPYGLVKTGFKVIATLRDKVNIGQVDTFKASQGGASDGKYYYVTLMKKVNNVETGVIVKYDIAEGKRTAVSAELAIDHCNDMTWDPIKNELIITNMNGKLLTVVDPETLTVKRAFTADALPGTPYGISYNAEYDCYVILAGGKVNLVDRDKFTVIRSFPMISMNYTGQGVDSDSSCVYIPMSKAPDKGSNDNVIVVYDIKTGSVISQIHINDGIEIETMFNMNGVYYANFNTSGSTIYRLEFGAYMS